MIPDRLRTAPRPVAPSIRRLVLDGAVPLSQLDAAFARHREAYIAGKQGEWPLRIIAWP